jgi:hypothetical protein
MEESSMGHVNDKILCFGANGGVNNVAASQRLGVMVDIMDMFLFLFVCVLGAKRFYEEGCYYSTLQQDRERGGFHALLVRRGNIPYIRLVHYDTRKFRFYSGFELVLRLRKVFFCCVFFELSLRNFDKRNIR